MSRKNPQWLLLTAGLLLAGSLSLHAQSYHSALYPPAMLNPLQGRIEVFGCAMDRNAASRFLGYTYIVGFNSATTLTDPVPPPEGQLPYKIFVAAFTPAGSLRWSLIYENGGALAAVVDSQSAVVVATSAGVLRFEYDASDNVVLKGTYPMTGVVPQEVALDASDNVYVTGYTPASQLIYTVRLDKTAGGGLTLASGWPRTFGNPGGANEGRAIVVKGGAVYVAGTGYRASTAQDALILKYPLTGGTPAEFWYDGSIEALSDDGLNDLAVDAGDNVFATGYTNGATEFSGFDYLTLKLAASSFNTLAWTARYDAPGQVHPTPVSSTDKASFLALDPAGSSVFVTGSSTVLQSDIVTAKYSAASGAPLAISRFDGGIVKDAPAGLFVSSAGQVFVGGVSGSRYVLLARASDLSSPLYGTPSYVDMATLPGAYAGTAPAVACLVGRNTLAAPALFSSGFYKMINPPGISPLAAMGIQWIYP